MKIKFKEIESIKIHWSENIQLNGILGWNANGDIEKFVDMKTVKQLINDAADDCGHTSDITVLTVVKKDGSIWAYREKFYLRKGDTLKRLLNSDR